MAVRLSLLDTKELIRAILCLLEEALKEKDSIKTLHYSKALESICNSGGAGGTPRL